MTNQELADLAEVLAAVAKGEEWECMWFTTPETREWGAPGGRDVEYCICRRIPIRIKPKPFGSALAVSPNAAHELFLMLQRCEMWLSTFPQGRQMQLECQRVMTLATQ